MGIREPKTILEFAAAAIYNIMMEQAEKQGFLEELEGIEWFDYLPEARAAILAVAHRAQMLPDIIRVSDRSTTWLNTADLKAIVGDALIVVANEFDGDDG